MEKEKDKDKVKTNSFGVVTNLSYMKLIQRMKKENDKTNSSTESKTHLMEEVSALGKQYYEWAMTYKDIGKKIELLKISADLCNPDACCELYRYIKSNKFESYVSDVKERYIDYLICAADGGHLYDQLSLADYYKEEKDFIRAAKYYEMAYNNSITNPDEDSDNMVYKWACSELANMYLKGTGIIAPREETFYWTKKSAYSGCESHFIALAGLYFDGKGVEENPYEAYIWVLICNAYDDGYAPQSLLNGMAISFSSYLMNVLEREAKRRLLIMREQLSILTDEDVAQFKLPEECPILPHHKIETHLPEILRALREEVIVPKTASNDVILQEYTGSFLTERSNLYLGKLHKSLFDISQVEIVIMTNCKYRDIEAIHVIVDGRDETAMEIDKKNKRKPTCEFINSALTPSKAKLQMLFRIVQPKVPNAKAVEVNKKNDKLIREINTFMRRILPVANCPCFIEKQKEDSTTYQANPNFKIKVVPKMKT